MFAASKTSRLVPAGPTSDTYFNYVTSLLHGDGTNGGQNNTFLDSSTNAFTITNNGDTSQGTFTPFNGGNYSNYFDGSGDYLDIPNSAAFNQSGAWTVEMWVFPTTSTVAQYWYSQVTPNFLQIATNSSGFVVVDKSSVGIQLTATTAVQTNAWNHVAMISTGTLIGLFVNGILQGTASIGTTAASATTTRIGAYQGTGGLAFTGFISNVRVTKGTALYTGNFTPSTLPLNTTSQTVLLTCASNRFEDLSGANNTITKNGDTAVQTFSPFVQSSSTPTSYGVTFNGTTDYLIIPNNAAFTFGTGDFTVECWAYWNSVVDVGFFGSSAGGGQDFAYVAGTLRIGRINTAWDNQFAFTPSAGQWYHIAFTRSGTTARAFVNGVQVGTSGTNSVSYSQNGSTSFIGVSNPPDRYMNGCISNLRVVKGTALYTSNFTPSTTPLTAISGTSLLTCQNSTFIDNSSNSFSITTNGSPKPIKGNPFGYTIAATTGYSVALNGGSGYFDGNGDYLNFAGGTATTLSGDFTIEGWIYATNFAALQILMCIGDDYTATGALFYIGTEGKLGIFSNSTRFYTGTTIAASNTWMHVAFVRSGTTVTGYLNGVSQGAVTNSSTFSGTNSYIVQSVS